MNEINFEIKDVEKIDLSMDVGVKEIFPPIENLEVTPTKEQQVFNHENSYGYDEIKVNAIPDEYIIPDGTLEVAENGDIDVTTFKIARVGVYTPPTLQDKSITITENGTKNITFDEGYDGLNSVEVTTNIEGSGEEPITDLEQCGQKMIDDMKSYVDYIKNKPETYDVYTNEPVTLYSPKAGYNNYVIRYRAGSEMYCVVWFADDVTSLEYNSDTTFYTNELLTRSVSASRIDVVTPNSMLFSNQKSTIGYMYTSNSSIEDCIEAMKSPTTVYTKSSSSYGWGYVKDNSGYMLPVTNMPCFKNGELQHGRRISSNETIQVIG